MATTHTWNQHVVKKGNKSIVLQYIRESSPASRAKIAKVTGLNKGTVSSLVSELIDENLIYESGSGESSGGRRPLILNFNELAGFSIGIDVGVNYMLGLLTDLNGNIIKEEKLNYRDLNYEEIKTHLFSMIRSLISHTPKCKYGVVGIGIGVPGVVSKDGEVLLAPNLNWKNIELKKLVEDEFNIPVIVENEANAGAYGEKKFGVGHSFDHVLYISVGTGIGVGIILNGKLYQGNKGFSGELGHMTIELNGPECMCGNIGCWELYASENALMNEAEKVLKKKAQDRLVGLEDLIDLADHNPQIANLFEEVGKYLGLGVNNIINIFNPQQVIIGNRLSLAKKWIEQPIKNHVKNHTQSFQQEDLHFDFAKLSTHSSALGVIAFTVESFLQIDLVTS